MSEQSSIKEHYKKSDVVTDVPTDRSRDVTDESRITQVLMLPHNNSWCLFVMLATILHIHLTIFIFVYMLETYNVVIQLVHYVLEIIYALYIGSIIIHSTLSIHKNDLCIAKTPFVLVFLGCLSLLPIFEVITVVSVQRLSTRTCHLFKSKVLIRFGHVLVYILRKKADAGIRQIYVFLFVHIFRYTMTFVIFGIILFTIGSPVSEEDNWMKHLNLTGFDSNNHLDRWLIPNSIPAALLAGLWSDNLHTRTVFEDLVGLACLVEGARSIVVHFIAPLTAQFIHIHKKKILFNIRMKNTERYMKDNGFDEYLILAVKEFFRVSWNKRNAIDKIPPCFSLLPLSLQKDITLDMNWDLIEHSHLFRNLEMSVKRDLSLLIENESYMAGDVIYHRNELKTKLIYISSGILQILSEEDDETPVMSFSSGTILSEACCLFPLRSTIRVVSATYCELRVLHLSVLCRHLNKQMSLPKVLRTIFKRIDVAISLNTEKKMATTASTDAEIENLHLKRPIRRMKIQWRMMLGKLKTRDLVVSKCHTNRYLDLFVLSNEMELKVKVICLTSQFPFILDPDSSFRFFLDMLCLVCVIVQSGIIMLYDIFYNDEHELYIILEFVNYLDIALQLTTAVKDADMLRTEFCAIVQHRIRQLSFQIDLLSTFPYQHLLNVYDVGDGLILLKLPRIIRVYKVYSLLASPKFSLASHFVVLKILKHAVLFCLFVIYVLALIYIYSNIVTILAPEKKTSLTLDRNSTDRFNAVTHFLYVVLLLSVGGDSGKWTNYYVEIIIFLTPLILGFYLAAFRCADVTAFTYWTRYHEIKNKLLIMDVVGYLRMERIHESIVARVKNIFRFRWDFSNDLVICDSMEIFKDMPRNLHRRIQKFVMQNTIETVELFKGLDSPVIERILKFSKVMTFPPKAIIVASEDVPEYIYIIRRGFCSRESFISGDKERETDKRIITEGSCFPFIEAFHGIPTYLTVTTLTAVEAIAVPFYAFKHCLEMDFANSTILRNIVARHYESHKPLFTEALKGRVTTIYKPRKNIPMFKYNVSAKSAQKTGSSAWIVRLFESTVPPTGTFFKSMEILRCCLAITQFSMIIFEINLLFHAREIILILNKLLDVTCWIDMIIQTRLHFYNENGILVTTVKETTRNYLSGAFYLDLWSSFPYYVVALQANIGDNPVEVELILLLCTRTFQLKRVFGALDFFFMDSKYVSELFVMRTKVLMIMFIILTISSNLFVLLQCEVSPIEITCFFNETNVADFPSMAFFHSTYRAMQYMARSPSKTRIDSTFDKILIFVMLLFLYTAGWIFTTRLIGIGLHSESMVPKMKNDQDNFLNFAKQEFMLSENVNKALSFIQFRNRNVDAFSLARNEQRITPELFADICYSFDRKPLKNTILLKDAPRTLIRHIATKVHCQTFMKDTIIIGRNQVHKDIYILRTGKVDVTVANTLLEILTPGAMFGCFKKQSSIRQTISVSARVHTEVLQIENEVFHDLISQYPDIGRKLAQYELIHAEHIAAAREFVDQIVTKESDTNLTCLHKLHMQITSLFNDRKIKIFDYILKMHVAPLSSIYTMIVQMQCLYGGPALSAMWAALYVIDVPFVVHIFISALNPYVDDITGLRVTNPKLILRKYLKEKFTVDFICILMPELYLLPIANSNNYILAILISPRVLRFLFLVRHYRYLRRNKKLANHLRKTFLAYMTLLYIHFFVNVWSAVACRNGGCIIKYPSDIYRSIKLKSTIRSITLAYTFIVCILSQSRENFVRKMNGNEYFLTTLIYIVSIVMLGFIISGVVTLKVIHEYGFMTYNKQTGELMTYLKYQRISPVILKTVREYYLMLWVVQNGEQLPSLLKQCSPTVQQNVMNDVYGHHLLNHPFFKKTHVDFLHQVVAKFNRRSYISQYVIVEANDVDDRMYFIHKGSVSVTEKSTVTKREVEVLNKNDCFGEMTGLFRKPHRYTYTAKTHVDIVILFKDDWEYLLDHFPASKEEIMSQAQVLFSKPESSFQENTSSANDQ